MKNYEAEFFQLELIYSKVCSANKSILSIEELGDMIRTLSQNCPWNMESYSRCLIELIELFDKLKYERSNLNEIDKVLEYNQKFLNEAKLICLRYIEPLRNLKYSTSKYTTQYRKEHYKQLNIDLFPEDKDAFVEAVKYNGDTIKNVLRKFILEYIEQTEKEKNKQDK